MHRIANQRPKKRSDWIADQIKGWIVLRGKAPGDRLPPERELLRIFGAGRGTVREALKSLEVQGLIVNLPGSDGGAVLAEVPYGQAMQLLRNYFHFRTVTFAQVYAVRKLTEPELAAAATGRLSEAQMDELARYVEVCDCGDYSRAARRREQRIAELEFHNVLATACPNPILAFLGRFLNDVLRDLVAMSESNFARHEEFRVANCGHHRQLLEALRAGDAMAVRKRMLAHMRQAEADMVELDARLEGTWLGPPQMHQGGTVVLESLDFDPKANSRAAGACRD
jgi:GntR family transcriptional regulator, transcriptional repressor for pyruvate dehydrogenase complex